VKQAIFAYANHARIISWNQLVLNNDALWTNGCLWWSSNLWLRASIDYESDAPPTAPLCPCCTSCKLVGFCV